MGQVGAPPDRGYDAAGADPGSQAPELRGSTDASFHIVPTCGGTGRRPARSHGRVRAGRARTGRACARDADRLARGDHRDGRRVRPHPGHRARRRRKRDGRRGPLSAALRAVLEPGGAHVGVQHLHGVARRPHRNRASGRVRRAGAGGGLRSRPVRSGFGRGWLPAAARSAHHPAASAGVDRADRRGTLLRGHRGDAPSHSPGRRGRVRGRRRDHLGHLGRGGGPADRPAAGQRADHAPGGAGARCAGEGRDHRDRRRGDDRDDARRGAEPGGRHHADPRPERRPDRGRDTPDGHGDRCRGTSARGRPGRLQRVGGHRRHGQRRPVHRIDHAGRAVRRRPPRRLYRRGPVRLGVGPPR